MCANIIKSIITEEERTKLKEVRNLLEDIIENIDILLDDETVEKLQAAEEDIKKGRVRNWDEFEEELEITKKE